MSISKRSFLVPMACAAALGVVVAGPAAGDPRPAGTHEAEVADFRPHLRARMHRQRERHDFVERLLASADQVELSQEQRDKLVQIRRKSPGALMPKRQAVAEARIDLHDLMAKEDASATDLRRAHDRLLQARRELSAAAFDLHVQARDVLTPAQREKLHDAMDRPGRQGLHERFRRGGRGGGSFDEDSGLDEDGF